MKGKWVRGLTCMTPEKRVQVPPPLLFYSWGECILRSFVYFGVFLCMCVCVPVVPFPYSVTIPLWSNGEDRTAGSLFLSPDCSHSKLNGLLLLTGLQRCHETVLTGVRYRTHHEYFYLLCMCLSFSFSPLLSETLCQHFSLFSFFHLPLSMFIPFLYVQSDFSCQFCLCSLQQRHVHVGIVSRLQVYYTHR